LTACDPEIVSLLFNQENIAGFDGDQYLKKLQCPVLLLQANPDLGGVLSDADIAVAKAIKPDVNVLLFQDAGHFMHLHDPQATVKAMTHFFTSTERQRARDG
jgi:pimeloyl-ACP methyl ester carboxylesterase